MSWRQLYQQRQEYVLGNIGWTQLAGEDIVSECQQAIFFHFGLRVQVHVSNDGFPQTPVRVSFLSLSFLVHEVINRAPHWGCAPPLLAAACTLLFITRSSLLLSFPLVISVVASLYPYGAVIYHVLSPQPPMCYAAVKFRRGY